jgi:isopentenyl diphosphate isomerase/L-lactate dehydrogenase-like FMN-dependent dehydrogenase
MDRRDFGKLIAASTGGHLLAGSAAAADQPPASTAKPAPPRESGDLPGTESDRPPAGEPVSVADFRALAKTKLPRPTFDFVETGSTDEVTLRENVEAFRRVQLLPPILAGVPEADLSTTVLGTPVKLPILLAPVAAQRMYHPEGALAAARAAAAMGTVFGVSSSATSSIEEIARAADGPRWYQLYVPRDRGIARQLVERAERAGYKALVLTVDLGEYKDADRRNRFSLPREMLVKHLRDVGFSGIRDDMAYDELIAFNSKAWDLTFGWEIFDWLRSITKLPLLVKGVLRPKDARQAVSIGLDGIVVSNHGGRRLDGVPATITMLPHIVQAVAGEAEVFLDSGVRRGTDVLKALAYGARAVLIGRAYAWGLAADGEAGVRKVLELLRDELQSALTACGCAKIAQVQRELIWEDPAR